MDYEFTKNWFQGSELHQNILTILETHKIHNILEIGCYEGKASCFFSDNLLDNEESTLDCVDPFLYINNNDHKDLLINDEEKRFDSNIRNSKHFDKVLIHKITSDDFFIKNNKTFNLIYIDGCHKKECVKKDLKNSLKILKDDGIIWVNDYDGGTKEDNIKKTVDTFIEENNCEIIHQHYQIAFKKKI